jgi:pimeloyl-ACP methyl ester carboxylesterase
MRAETWSAAFRGRLPREEWYPAHEPGLVARQLALPDGEEVRVVDGGPADGDPVVFVHGWACSAYFFRKLLPPIMATGRRVLALDLRGHGGSSKPLDERRYTDVAMRDFVLRALDAAGVGASHLVAHSLGGGVAIDVARGAPDRVTTLTLLAPVGLAPVRFVTLARLATPLFAAPLVPYAVPRWSIPLMLRALYGHDGTFASRDVDEYWAPTADEYFALALRALLHHYRFSARDDHELRAVQAPTLLLLGGRDLLVRSMASRRRAGTLPGWRCVTFAGAGPVLAEEVAEQVLREMLPHLDLASATAA